MSDYPNELTPELKGVLGLMIFSTAPIAHALRADGEDIPRESEAEQAHVLHWMIGLALEHGQGWRDKVVERLTRIAEEAER